MDGRPAIVHLDEHVAEGRARVAVTLTWENDVYVGEAEGPDDVASRPRIVGEATVRAVESVASGELRLSLEAVATTEIGDTRLAMAQLRIVGTNHLLVGNALLGDAAPGMATVKAVLDAINRPLGNVI